jgi:hypothetical protein
MKNYELAALTKNLYLQHAITEFYGKIKTATIKRNILL